MHSFFVAAKPSFVDHLMRIGELLDQIKDIQKKQFLFEREKTLLIACHNYLKGEMPQNKLKALIKKCTISSEISDILKAVAKVEPSLITATKGKFEPEGYINPYSASDYKKT